MQFRKIVEYIADDETKAAKGEKVVDSLTGLKRYRFSPRDEIEGVRADGRWVEVVTDEKTYDDMVGRMSRIFAPALDLDARLAARDFLATVTDPAVASEFAAALESLGFRRDSNVALPAVDDPEEGDEEEGDENPFLTIAEDLAGRVADTPVSRLDDVLAAVNSKDLLEYVLGVESRKSACSKIADRMDELE